MSCLPASARPHHGVRSQLYVALDCGHISQEQFTAGCQLAERAARQIAGFVRYLESLPNDYRIRDDGGEYVAG